MTSEHEQLFYDVAEHARTHGLNAVETLRELRRRYAQAYQGGTLTPGLLSSLLAWERLVRTADMFSEEEHLERVLAFLDGGEAGNDKGHPRCR